MTKCRNKLVSPSAHHPCGDQLLTEPSDRPVPTPPFDAFVVDDEAGVCQYISMVLSSLGLASQTFQTSERAIAALEDGHPEIVFLDIALGGTDAIDVIRSLSEKRYTGTVQLISGSKSELLDDVYHVGASYGLNMGEPLQKPFKMEAVRRALAGAPLWGRPEIAVSLAPDFKPDLDEALANDWLELWYQPKIDLRTNLLAGAEALIRLCHPAHDARSIDGLLAFASAQARATITERFVVTALRDWDEMARAGVPLRIALNAGFDVLSNLDLIALARHNRPTNPKWPGLLLEVSEHEVVEDPALANEIATQLRIYEIALAINNFGAGSSSLERLRELPFSELKLHPAFVSGCAEDARGASICRATIDLAHRFNAVAVADGLEIESDLRALRNMGCDVAQGPLFAEAMPKSQFIAAIIERQRVGQVWLRE
jgi:EAL domain-containing protein (putative c-di-GMP-specific phosphodiesterase class I)